MFIKKKNLLIIIIVILGVGSSGECSGLFNGGSAIASVAFPGYGDGRVCRRQMINNNRELLQCRLVKLKTAQNKSTDRSNTIRLDKRTVLLPSDLLV